MLYASDSILCADESHNNALGLQIFATKADDVLSLARRIIREDFPSLYTLNGKIIHGRSKLPAVNRSAHGGADGNMEYDEVVHVIEDHDDVDVNDD